MTKLSVLFCLNLCPCLAFDYVTSSSHQLYFDEENITDTLKNMTRLKNPVDLMVPSSQLEETLATHYSYIYTIYNRLLDQRAELYLCRYMNKLAELRLRQTLNILGGFCSSAEKSLGTQDYIKYIEPVFAYMEIKFFHVTLNLVIKNSSIETNPDLIDLSAVLMEEIEKAKTKYGFDFYTMMEREVHPNHPK